MSESQHPPQQPTDDVITTPEELDANNPVAEETEEALLQKVVEYKGLAQRALADYQNLQRESEQKLTDMRKFANDRLLEEFCPLVDYFDSAFKAIPEDQQSAAWIQGVKHIQTYLLQILKTHGVERMEVVGKPFDPHVHEAVGEEVSAEQPDGNVVREAQAGFMLNGKVLRHAKVIVSKK